MSAKLERCDWCDHLVPSSYLTVVGENKFCADCVRSFERSTKAPLVKGDTDRPGCGAWITLTLFVVFVVLVGIVYVILTAGDAPAWVPAVVL